MRWLSCMLYGLMCKGFGKLVHTPSRVAFHGMTALAVEAFAPDMAQFQSGRDFAAWLGLVPRQHSTGG